MKPSLHIVNGASLAGPLRQTGQADHIAYWHEALYVGPLALTDDTAFSRLRGQWWGDNYPPTWRLESPTGPRRFPHLTALRPELSRFATIVLWFEYDLYDQTMLWYILRQLAPHQPALPPLFLISPDRFPGIADFRGLGQLQPEQLRTLFGSQVAISPAQFEAATVLWETFAGQDLTRLRTLAEQPSPLPYAQRALQAWLKQVPQPPLNLGDIQATLLRRLREIGPCPVLRLVGDVMGSYDRDYGLSDFAAIQELVALSEDRRGLIEFCREGKSANWDAGLVKELEVRITPAGDTLDTRHETTA